MGEPLRGTLVVGQSGGPTPVINASLAGVIGEAQQHDCFTGILGLVHGIEGALKEQLLDLAGETAANLDLLSHTPASALGSCRHKLSAADYGRILAVFRAHDVRHFVYIGGNDSMDTCHRIWALAHGEGYELQVMGVPKTIDNDLAYTDHSPGYGSAARFLALATRDTGRDLEAMATFDDVTILEAMGRNAGWLTAAAALGKTSEDEAPHLVYVPEVAFDEACFLEDVASIHGRLGRVFVVVSEGIRDAEGRFIGQQAQHGSSADAFGHRVHSLSTGVAAYLTALVHERLGLQARFLRPGLIGRSLSACVAETDRSEALAVGRQAVAHLAAGGSGHMVTLQRLSDEPYRGATGLAPLSAVANAEHVLPREYINEAGNMLTQAFWRYALPLIDGPLPPLARLQGNRVPIRII
jgi:ATP-dependent phosphofructokinase / diphosphate-dependent phosphofructokinase